MIAPKLPTLRRDLQLLSAAPANDGSPRWSVYDPIAHQYTSVGHLGFAALSHWQDGLELTAFVDRLAALDIQVDEGDLEALLKTIEQQQWAVADSAEANEALISRARASQKTLFHRVLHGYLFFKVPLVKPDPWIGQLASFLMFLRSPTLQAVIIALGLLGLVSVIRQWSVFISTFPEFFNWQGAGLYALALVALKAAHEMGHAIVAKWKGVRVGAMGIAFLVLFPIMYTDTTDAWRLKSRWDRLAIALAGMRVELAIAAIALFVWGVTEPGQLKTLCFVVATTAVISSLLVNLSPFMRFDGYFAMADITGIDNLQGRAFAVARWWLRRFLFGYSDPCPEPRSARAIFAMIVYSYGTWIYRFFLFIGIAVLVYNIAFKLLGILLFVVEIWFFIARPIFSEIRHWWSHRSQARWRLSGVVSLIVLVGAGAWVSLPLRSTIASPAVLTAGQVNPMYPAESGWVERSMGQPGQVEAGTLLAEIRPPNQRFEKAELQARLDLVDYQLETLTAAAELDQLGSLQATRDGLISQLDALKLQAQRTQLRAPADGYWVPALGLANGHFWDVAQPLGEWIGMDSKLVAYIPLVERDRLGSFDDIRFIDMAGRTITGFQSGVVEQLAVEQLTMPELGSQYGGPLPVRNDQSGLMLEREYVRLTFERDDFPGAVRRSGVAHISAVPQSYLSRAANRVIEILRAEAGF